MLIRLEAPELCRVLHSRVVTLCGHLEVCRGTSRHLHGCVLGEVLAHHVGHASAVPLPVTCSWILLGELVGSAGVIPLTRVEGSVTKLYIIACGPVMERCHLLPGILWIPGSVRLSRLILWMCILGRPCPCLNSATRFLPGLLDPESSPGCLGCAGSRI